MKKLFTRLSLLSLFALPAIGVNAQQLGEAQIVNPSGGYYQTFLQTVTVTWNHTLITMPDFDRKVSVTINGKDFEVYADPYYSPEYEWSSLSTRAEGDEYIYNELIIDFSDEAYAEGHAAGYYVINLPEGIVQAQDGATNEQQIISFYKLDTVAPVSITPENEKMYTASELAAVTITFDDTIVLNENASPISARIKNDWLGNPTFINPTIGEDGKSLVLDLSELPNGNTYTVEIPELCVMIGEDYANEEIWLEYLIWDGMQEGTFISAPEHLTTPDINPFVLTWDYQPITICDNAPDIKVVYGYPDYGMQFGWKADVPAEWCELVYVQDPANDALGGELNAISLDLRELLEDCTEDDVEVTFPAGLVQNGEGLKNPAQSYMFRIKPTSNFTLDINAASGVIDLYWIGSYWATYSNDDNIPAYVESTSGYKAELEFNYGGAIEGEIGLINEDRHGISIDLSGLDLADGTYTLVVPGAYLILIDKDDREFVNEEVRYTFIYENGDFAGIHSVEGSDNGVITVYNMQGVKVMETNNRMQLKSLDSGLYIIDGKKLFIRK